ncbi:hypothetical protein E2C01_070655 [Portunus trituberculatus]|uniref:Uncharacterized protein n=1 Tax=Portunus trituberculatus TaxID=210409 RepID=A0A5B7I5U8_PORTR|nr:hypothetical protein [Portunus trituberculatus]
MNNLELPDRIDLLKRDRKDTRGHGLKLRRDNYRRDFKKNSSHHRVIDIWNGLDREVVCVKSTYNFKRKSDTVRYSDGTS